MAVERVAGCLWNRWPDHRGMGGRMVMESVAGWARNTHFKLHALKGKDRGRWSIWVNGNWRITFQFRDGHAYVLDYEDYH